MKTAKPPLKTPWPWAAAWALLVVSAVVFAAAVGVTVFSRDAERNDEEPAENAGLVQPAASTVPEAAVGTEGETAAAASDAPSSASSSAPSSAPSNPPPDPTAPPASYRLDAPLIAQLPELYNGCEITSLTMLSQFLGLPYTKFDLVARMPVDPTEPVYDASGDIAVWGDPNRGFVGDVTGRQKGYSIYSRPLAQVLNSIYPAGARDLTGASFAEIERSIAAGRPVVVWTTTRFAPTDDWTMWNTPDGIPIMATFSIHAVLVVGYDERFVYVNDPLTAKKAAKVEKSAFILAWEQLGRQALTAN